MKLWASDSIAARVAEGRGKSEALSLRRVKAGAVGAGAEATCVVEDAAILTKEEEAETNALALAMVRANEPA